MLTEYVTEGSKDKYHTRLNCGEIITTRGAAINYISAEVVEGADVARVDLALLNGNKIELLIQGLRQGIALIHVYMYFADSTVETFCMHHRGVNC